MELSTYAENMINIIDELPKESNSAEGFKSNYARGKLDTYKELLPHIKSLEELIVGYKEVLGMNIKGVSK